jgi:hypothetical protein
LNFHRRHSATSALVAHPLAQGFRYGMSVICGRYLQEPAKWISRPHQ